MRFVLWLCPLVLWSSGVRADPARNNELAIVNLRIDLADSERAQARATIENALKKAGLVVSPDSQVQQMRSTTPGLFNCFIKNRCRIDLGRALFVDYLLTGSIGKEDRAYVMQLDVLNVGLATTVRGPAVCPRCSPQQFDKRLAEVVEKGAREARQLPSGRLVVHTRPPGAAVKVDEYFIGESNTELSVSAGTHILELSGSGRSPISMPVEVKANERHEVDIKMAVQKGPASSTPVVQHPESSLTTSESRPSWWRGQRIAGVTLVSTGAALALASIAPFLLDGGCSSSTVGYCLYRFHTKAAGIGLAAAGTAVGVTGVIVILTTPRQSVQASLAPVVSQNGAGLFGEIHF